MANTYEAIATVTVGSGGAATIDFTSIPGTYTDLLVKISGRNTSSGRFINVTFNSDTTAANYEGRYIEGNGASASSAADQDQTVGYVSVSSYTASTFGNSEFYIPNYANTSTYKSFSADGVMENNATTAFMGLFAGLWKSNSAITSISLALSSNNFAQYSTATLYGIKNS